MTEPNPGKIAILIDAENVLPSFADLIFSNAESLGEIVAKEIYGVAAALTTWVEPVLRYAIHPNLTIKASKGKNTSDIALVIGAMELLLTHDVNTVVIASSDSDFSGLSVRLRTAGIRVVGMGTEKSNPLWRTACTDFMVLEHPASAPKSQPQPSKPQQQKPQQQPKPQLQQQQPKQQPQPKAQQPQQAPNPPAQPVKPAPSTHKDRVAAIQQVILKRLASGGGRVQASTLFSALNRLPEYRVDRQGANKKPLNYLTSTFADIFNFEDSSDGKVWVTVKGPATAVAAPAAEGPAVVEETVAREEPVVVEETVATEEAPVVEEPGAVEEPVVEVVEEEPAEEEAPVVEETVQEEAAEPETQPELVVEEVESADTEPKSVPEVEEIAEPAQEPATDPTVTAFIDRLVRDGMEAEIAENIARILAESSTMFMAYNTLRKAYGSDTGREYYNRAKEILSENN